MSIYGGVGKCRKEIMDLAIESSSPHPHKAIDFQAMQCAMCLKKDGLCKAVPSSCT